MNLDELVLSGALFSHSRSTSPVRSPSRSRSASPDPLFPSNVDYTDTDVSVSPSGAAFNSKDVPSEMHMRPGRTGVKGVIQDHNEAVNLQRAKQAQEIKETNKRMEKMALTARTFAEDEEDRLLQKAKDEGIMTGGPPKRLFERVGRGGHLREIDETGFLRAIDGEMAGTWVVLHIYDPALTRCRDVDSVLARLARQYPLTRFLRARAAAVGFATLTEAPSFSGSTANSHSNLISDHDHLDEDEDAYVNSDEENDQAVTTDLDMLPTMLVYRAGQIVHNWIRVDWEAEAWCKYQDKNEDTNPNGIEALLRGHNIIQSESNGNCGFSSDEDDRAFDFVQGDIVDDDDLFDL